MKKLFLSSILFLFLIFIMLISYLVLFGFETNKFNNFIENKINFSEENLIINIDKIKVKINLMNLNFFMTTSDPYIEYRGNKIDIKKIDGYIKLNSFLSGNPQIDKINLVVSPAMGGVVIGSKIGEILRKLSKNHVM